MDNKEFQDYLENRYKKQMDYYKNASARNQKRYRQFQWILIVLSALTPVLAALITKWPELQISVVVVSAIVAILTTGLKTFQFQELWVTYRTTYEQLKPEIHYYHFGVGPYHGNDVDREVLFVSRIETLLDEEHKQWPISQKLKEEKNKNESSESTTTPESNENPSS